MDEVSLGEKEYVPELLKKVLTAAKKSNELGSPDQIAHHQTDSEVRQKLGKLQSGIKKMLSSIVRFVSPETDSTDYNDIVEAADQCLEHVAKGLDTLKGNISQPLPVLSRVTNYELPKPQLKFPVTIDNSKTRFVPILKEKPNALSELNPNTPHPYRHEIEHLQFKQTQLFSQETSIKQLEEIPLQIVQSQEEFEAMLSELKQAKEIAVDLEHHNFRSYQGFLCLMQVSTREKDYVVDPFPIWNEMHKLLPVFTDPEIVKVFHGADMDVVWLQRDFGLYIVNMFDTGRASRKLMFPKFSLAYLLQSICDVKTDKSYQLADWRVRPLTPDMIMYARMDTHYLLYIYDVLKQKLTKKACQLKMHELELIREVFQDSKEVCLKKYEKPDLKRVGITKKPEFMSIEERVLLEDLMEWRDEAARQEDESPSYILSGKLLTELACRPPKDFPHLMSKVPQQSPIFKRDSQKILEIITQAKEKAKSTTHEESIKLLHPAKPHTQRKLKTFTPQERQAKYTVTIFKPEKSLIFYDENPTEVKPSVQKKCQEISKQFHNYFAVILPKETTMQVEQENPQKPQKTKEKSEEIPQSVQEKYSLPRKKLPTDKRLKINIHKKQKLTDKGDMKVGWLDNVELAPVKRKDLFRKKKR